MKFPLYETPFVWFFFFNQMYSQLFEAQQKHQVALEVLTYHCCVLESDVQQWHNSVAACTLPDDFYRYVSSLLIIFYELLDELFKSSVFLYVLNCSFIHGEYSRSSRIRTPAGLQLEVTLLEISVIGKL